MIVQIPVAKDVEPDETFGGEDVAADVADENATFPFPDPTARMVGCAGCGQVYEQHQVVGGKCQPCNTKDESVLFLNPAMKTNNLAVVAAINQLAAIVAKSVGQEKFDALVSETKDG